MAYLWFKAFHLVGIVAWFGGLFYLVRIFIYHVEANEKPEPARSILQEQFQIMEKRAYHIIAMPAMILTIAMAIGLLTTEPEVLKEPWLHIKLLFVVALVGYHHYCGRLIKQLEANQCRLNSQQLRWFNEVPTLFLVAIVLLAIFKNSLPTDITVWVMAAMVLAFAIGIQLYAKQRRLDRERAAQPAAEISEMEAKGSAS